ncbi:YfiR family protein [Agarivorans sp. MS3-6]|uniref:YfiR family protein n=1 Tax=Agarivorans sp. TSD2052 TaxID=2937286 RepID=UPI00200CDBDB|nr:YfiR family protein [Agarivorans sp. TSD2052]UPW20234.1 YfiR family protein [Agarivorans sp. TSD2052]
MMAFFKRPMLVISLISYLLFSPDCLAANDKELSLKAGFVFNFARYSEWQDQAPLVGYFRLCSPDISFVDSASEVLAEQTIHDLPILISYMSLDSSDITQCNLLFISAAYQQQWQQVDKRLLPNTMLVGEAANFMKNGGHIRFFLLAGKIRFEVDPEKLKQSGIVMSSKVLRLSRIVKGAS